MGLWGGEVLSAAGGGVAGELMALTDPKGNRAELSSGAQARSKMWDWKLVQVPCVPLPPSLK